MRPFDRAGQKQGWPYEPFHSHDLIKEAIYSPAKISWLLGINDRKSVAMIGRVPWLLAAALWQCSVSISDAVMQRIYRGLFLTYKVA